MKTTLEIPDPIFRRAKAKAAEQQKSLREFVTEALSDKLNAKSQDNRGAKLKVGGALRHLRKETARINAIIEQEFEQIDEESF
jgi:hypothetical protein